MDKGSPSTAVNYRSSQVQVPSPLGQSSISAEIETQPEPENKKPPPPPPHPLAVDWNRPVRFVDPRPRACHLDLCGRVPLPTYPDNPYPERSLDEALEGLVDTEVVKELADLMWKQQKRVWDSLGGYVDHYLLRPVPIFPITEKSLKSDEEPVFVESVPDSAPLYAPVPRNNESIHLGESLTNPNVIILDDDEDEQFGKVLDLYRGAVQGSILSRELEIEVGVGVEYASVGWGEVSALEVSVKRVVEPVPRKEEPPLGIEWSYSSCGYAAGRVVNVHNAITTAKAAARASNKREQQPHEAPAMISV